MVLVVVRERMKLRLLWWNQHKMCGGRGQNSTCETPADDWTMNNTQIILSHRETVISMDLASVMVCFKYQHLICVRKHPTVTKYCCCQTRRYAGLRDSVDCHSWTEVSFDDAMYREISLQHWQFTSVLSWREIKKIEDRDSSPIDPPGGGIT